MPVTTGMPNFNNIDIESVNSRAELMDALYAVLEEIRHIDTSVGEDNLTDELLEKVNAGAEAAKTLKASAEKDVPVGQTLQIYPSLDATGLIAFTPSNNTTTIPIVLRNMLPNTIISWTHSKDHTYKFIGAPPVPEDYGVVTCIKGGSLNIDVAIFFGRSGNVYIIKYGDASLDAAYPEYVGVWRRMPIAASAITIKGVNEQQSLSATPTVVDINQNNKVIIDTQFLTPVTKGVQCNRKGFVEISACMQANGVTAGDRLIMSINLGKNSALDSTAIMTTRWDAPTTRVTGTIAPFIQAVEANDLLYLFASNNNGNGNIPVGDQTYLTVRYV